MSNRISLAQAIDREGAKRFGEEWSKLRDAEAVAAIKYRNHEPGRTLEAWVTARDAFDAKRGIINADFARKLASGEVAAFIQTATHDSEKIEWFPVAPSAWEALAEENRHWPDVKMMGHVHAVFIEGTAPASNFVEHATGTRGRKKVHDRDKIRAEVFRLMDYHGEFTADDPDWNGPAKLAGKLQDKFNLANSTAYDFTAEYVAAWRASKAS